MIDGMHCHTLLVIIYFQHWYLNLGFVAERYEAEAIIMVKFSQQELERAFA
jgi:hypothetical protein